MNILRVRYAERIPGMIERHCAAFLTSTDEVIIISSILDSRSGDYWPFFNAGDAVRLAKDVMKGKKRSTQIAPIIGIIAWESTHYDEALVSMAKNGHLLNAVVIENIPESVGDLQQFAYKTLKESLV